MADDYKFLSVLFSHTLLIEEVDAVHDANIFII